MCKETKRNGYEYKIILRNLRNGKIFAKYYDTEYSARCFARKQNHFKNVRILDIENRYGDSIGCCFMGD